MAIFTEITTLLMGKSTMAIFNDTIIDGKLSPGWWIQHLWKMMEFVSWGYSQYMESHKIHVPNHQPASYFRWFLGVSKIPS